VSSPSGSSAAKTSVPGATSKTTVRRAHAVPPDGLTATTVMAVLPPLRSSVSDHEPSAATVVCAVRVEKSPSVFVPATWIVLPGVDVPLTTTDPLAGVRSSGALTVSAVVPWLRST
jgi:hypothetical protein